MKLFLKGRLHGLKYAFKGVYLLIKTEHSIMTQSFIFSLIILLGFILEISRSFPKKNQEIIFRNCTFKIENLDIKRIKQIKVTLA